MNFHEIKLSKRKNLKTLIKAKTKIIALEGGSGSGKSWDILFYLVYICQQNKNAGLRIMIGRAFYAWIEDSILADFTKVLVILDLWTGKLTKESHPKEHKLYGNTFHFRGADQEKKFHGPRWDIVFLNEMMEFKYESCSQVFMRTNFKILTDWNPYLMQHWVYDRILPRDDCTHVISTFFHNPNLPDEQRKEILGYEPTHPDDRHIQDKKKRRPHPTNITYGTADDRLWSVYGEGKRMAPEGLIFKYVNYIDSFPEMGYCYGMDFGWTVDPTTIVKVGETEKDIYLELLCYEPIETPETLDLFMDKISIERHIPITADSSDKYTGENKGTVEMVKGLRVLGWLISKVHKTKSIMFWLNSMKRKRINVVNNHLVMHFKEEFENYRMKSVNGIAINQPIDGFDHGITGGRYGHMSLNQSRGIRSRKE